MMSSHAICFLPCLACMLTLWYGGAVPHSRSGWVGPPNSALNLVNEHDMGREIQLSFYSPPAGYDTPDKKCSSVQPPAYKNFPWNPIGAGDLEGNAGTVLEVRAAAQPGRGLIRCDFT